MRLNALLCLFTVWIIATAFALSQAQPNQQNGPKASTAKPSKVVIEGLVRDIACAIQNPEATATDFNLQCAVACARHGSPLIVQTRGGMLYIPISDSMPDTDQRQKLMPFVGKFVRVRGIVYERNGTRAIVISELNEMKNVHLTTDAQ